MYHYKLIIHKLRFLRTGTKVAVVIHFEVCPVFQSTLVCNDSVSKTRQETFTHVRSSVRSYLNSVYLSY
jgi:hypothetical protein